jgi:hypothetical protein
MTAINQMTLAQLLLFHALLQTITRVTSALSSMPYG